MSEYINITIVMDDGKLNAAREEENGKSIVVTHDPSKTVMSTLLKNNLVSGSFCGGRGDCGRCRVQFLKGITLPTPLERSVMEPEELRQGYRLACLANPKDNCVIKLALADAAPISIVSDMISVTEGNDYTGQQNEQTGKNTSDVTKQAKYKEKKEALIAVDLGTTTIAMQLVELGQGQILDTYSEMNPQRCFGADVLSRMKASCEGNRGVLSRIVLEALERGVSRFMDEDSGQRVIIKGMCVACNTAMGHLLMRYDVSTLGRSPFVPVDIGLQEYRHPAWGFPIWLVPGISAFVGGDIVAGLYALHLLPSFCGDGGVALLIDLGTNGEMAVTDGERMIVTATAAGPAFEGGAGAGIIGSDMIACVSLLLQQRILDETGLLSEPYFTYGVRVGEPPVELHNKDIRDLQMAKAAVRAGIEILWKQMGEPEIEAVYLAGGFGYYLDVDAAFHIGLLPDWLHGKVRAVGNTSLAGAFMIGRDLYLKRINKVLLEKSLSHIESINLAGQESFEKLYVECMNFK